jgi:hypothetical protein
MKNNIDILKNIDNSAFLSKIKSHLGNNLNNYLITSLSNMLAIDYVNRLKKEPKIEEYVQKCVERLKKHLKHMVVTDESFAGVMTLFAIAITDKKEIGDGLVNTQEKNQDILIDGLVADQFSDLSPTEQKNVKEVLRALLNGRDGKEVMNFIHSDPKLFYSVVFSAYKEKTKQKEIMEVVTINLNKIIADTKFINRKRNNIKTLTAKITMAAGLVAIASTGVFIGGLMLPALIVPAFALSAKFAPVVGEKVGEIIAQNNNMVQKKQTHLKEFMASIVQPELGQKLSHSKAHKKDLILKPELVIKSQVVDILNQTRTKDINKKNSRQR